MDLEQSQDVSRWHGLAGSSEYAGCAINTPLFGRLTGSDEAISIR